MEQFAISAQMRSSIGRFESKRLQEHFCLCCLWQKNRPMGKVWKKEILSQ